MPLLEQVEIPAPHGFLEGLLRQPDAPGGAEADAGAPAMAALVCHPHPEGGGTMHNKVKLPNRSPFFKARPRGW